MSGLKIVSIRLNFFEDAYHASAQVVVEWSHSVASAASVLKMCGGLDLPLTAMLESFGADHNKAPLKTVRTFRFESREDALDVYDKFEEVLRGQKKEEVKVLNP